MRSICDYRKRLENKDNIVGNAVGSENAFIFSNTCTGFCSNKRKSLYGLASKAMVLYMMVMVPVGMD